MIYAVLYAFTSQVDLDHFRAYLGYSYSQILARQSRAWGEEALMLPEAGGEDEYIAMARLLM